MDTIMAGRLFWCFCIRGHRGASKAQRDPMTDADMSVHPKPPETKLPVAADSRLVFVNNEGKNCEVRLNGHYTTNWVATSKYTLLSFVPKTLFEFFRVIANCYFLFISVIQLATTWSPTNPYTTAGPLLIVLLVSMIKQAIEDKKRHDADAIQNSRKCTVLSADGTLVEKQWQHVLVGDVLFLKDKDELPADVLILATSEEEGRCFVETCNLDGETNLKRRTALEPVAKLIGFRNLSDATLDESDHVKKCGAFRGSIEYEQPNNRLYNFTGRIVIDATNEAVAIGPNNIILRGCSIRSCNYIFGIVLFAGKESKLMQNARSTPSKQSNVYKMVNRCIVLIFLTQFLLCMISTLSFNSWVGDYKNRVWYLPFIEADGTAFFTFLILYNNLVPISLYVSLDMVKVAQAKNISADPEMCHEGFHAIARTSDLNEDLGQIEYIFSDKTGTLTQNIMEFRKCSIGGVVYGYGSTEIAAAVAALAKHNATDGVLKSKEEGNISEAQIYLDKSINFDDPRLVKELATNGPNAERIHEFLTLLSVCHTVIPELNAKTGITNYRASSPDEEALVKAARCLGYNLKTPAPLLEVEVTHKGQSPTTKAFTILNVNEFNSTRKRMSLVAQFPDDRIVLLCKGADNVIMPRCKKDDFTADLNDQLKTFATEGLRTLVLAKRELTTAEYDDWNKTYQEAATSLVNRDQMLDDAAEALEVGMEIVGATAIEDKLQVGVPTTIFNLAQAGIKIWVLTGDKEETAVNIGHACRLLDDGMKLLYINRESADDLVAQVDYLYEMEAVQEHYKKKSVADDMAVVCDGKSLVHLFPAKTATPSAEEKAKAKELRRK
ncbi:phospholipid-transporting ATPase, partial [Achlya hypogyna]